MPSVDLSAYLDYLEIERNLSRGTIAAYKCGVGSLNTFLLTEGEGRSLDPKDAEETLRSWYRWLRTIKRGRAGGRLDTSTVALYIAGLRSYFDWEVLEKRRKRNPIRDSIRLPKQDEDARALVNALQLRRMFDACDQLDRPWDPLMARAILCFLAGNGLRVSEVQALAYADVDLDTKSLHLRVQKNNERSTLPIPASLLPHHRAWFDKREWMLHRADRRRVQTSRWLFYSPFRAVGKEGVYTLLRHLNELSGCRIPGLAPHSLRHYAITTWTTRGSAKDAQLLARHKRIETTSKYIHPDNDRLRNIVDAAGLAIVQPDYEMKPQQMSLELW